ncbi:hypothetical protein JCM33374_g6236 [Metschnikowia sp. JCM 33374]|nr:hypothetical protein JCM33374_g6236 [Metschnikowia sp. JCM 33374]
MPLQKHSMESEDSSWEHPFVNDSYRVDPFRPYNLQSESYTEAEVAKETFQFNAAQKVHQHSFEHYNDQFDLHAFVPYRLELKKAKLFPEFYFHFKRAFSKTSPENTAYCLYDMVTFKSLYVGQEADILHAVSLVEYDFVSKFTRCLDPQLLKKYATWKFTRQIVENDFFCELARYPDNMVVCHRLNYLFWDAHRGDFIPYVEFLMAYEHPPDYIWFQIGTILCAQSHSNSKDRFIEETMIAWKQAKIPLMQQIRGFVSDLSNGALTRAKQTDHFYDKFVKNNIELEHSSRKTTAFLQQKKPAFGNQDQLQVQCSNPIFSPAPPATPPKKQLSYMERYARGQARARDQSLNPSSPSQELQGNQSSSAGTEEAATLFTPPTVSSHVDLDPVSTEYLHNTLRKRKFETSFLGDNEITRPNKLRGDSSSLNGDHSKEENMNWRLY